MKSFKDLNIAPIETYVGQRIEILDVVDQEIIISKFKIEPSKYTDRGNGKCLVLQIKHENADRVIFTGSVILQETIQKVNPDDFPFKTTIIKLKPRGFKFT